MKKLLALMVALLMVVLPVATAEAVFTFSNPALTVGNTNYNVSDHEVSIAAGEIGGNEAYHIVISRTGLSVAIEVNIVGSTAYVMVNGKVLSIPMPAGISTRGLLTPSGIGVGALIKQMMDRYGQISGNTIRVPYTAVNQFLLSLVPTLQSVNIPNVDFSKVAARIENANKNNSGINLEGTFTETDNGYQLTLNGYRVRGGAASSNVGLTLAVTADNDSVNFSVDALARGNAHLSMTSDRITFDATHYGKTANGSVSYSVREEDVNLVPIDTASAANGTISFGNSINRLKTIINSGKFNYLYNRGILFANSLINAK